jgi:hypothetical protein
MSDNAWNANDRDTPMKLSVCAIASIVIGVGGFWGRISQLSLAFGPSGMHGASMAMILRYIDGKWVVTWRRGFYNM